MVVLGNALNRKTKPVKQFAAFAQADDTVRSILVDTGASGPIRFSDCEPFLLNRKISRCNITVANNQRLKVGYDGTLPMQVINLANRSKFDEQLRLDVETTTSDVPMEVFSFDSLYRSGIWGLHCRPTTATRSDAELYRLATDDAEALVIPFRYNWDGTGGF